MTKRFAVRGVETEFSKGRNNPPMNAHPPPSGNAASAGTLYFSATYPSPVGLLTLACEDDSLIGAWIEGQKYFGDALAGKMMEHGNRPVLQKAMRWLDRYFAGERPGIAELPLSPAGSDFRQRIWRELCAIPYGETVTYGDIAKKAAAAMKTPTMSSQAVGGAVGHNPLSIIIPCHRVVGSRGNLTGYAGGLGVKIKLLALEGVNTERLFVPRQGTAL